MTVQVFLPSHRSVDPNHPTHFSSELQTRTNRWVKFFVPSRPDILADKLVALAIMDHIPGEYPATPDEQPATLTQRLRHPLSTVGAGQHEHHEHNKLQKAQDPRIHKHADSGVGMFDAEPALGSTQRMSEYKPVELAADREVSTSPRNPSAGGLDATFSEPRAPVNEPLAPINESRALPTDALPTANHPLPTADKPHAPADKPHTTASTSSPNHNAGFIPAPHRAGDNGLVDERHPDNTSTKDTATPYWGNLPKAMSGGIYNTVMGHGSPQEDHTQHQNLPQKSASPPAKVGGDSLDYPKGGVYNTVAGHGSNDDETMRRNPPTGAFSETNQTTALGREPAQQPAASSGLAAAAFPMPQRHTQQPESLGTSSSTAMDAPPQPLASSGPAVSAAPDATRTTDRTASTSPRSFPLNSSQQDPRRQSADDAHAKHGYVAPAAAAAATVGAGAAATHHEDKPKKLQKPRAESPDEKLRRRSMGQSPDRRAHATQGLATHADGPASHSNRRATRGSESNSPAASDRKKHSILGIFHRHKDDKEEKTTVAKEPTADSSHHHDHNRKKEAAAAGAAGAGAYGLTKHHKDEKKDRHNSEPMTARHDPTAPAKRLSVNDHSTGAQNQPSAAYGALPASIDENVARRSGNDAPVPPVRSEKRRSGSPRAMAAMTAGTAHHSHDSTKDLQPQASRQSHDSVSRYSPGVAAGLGASVLAAGHDRSSVSPAQDPTSPVTFEHPRAPPSTPLDSKLVGGSKHGRSGSTSSPKTSHATSMVGDNTVANGPGEYNALHSGTASGVHSFPPTTTSQDVGARTHTPPHSNPTAGSSDETAYNVLSSGTPSGVKIGSRGSTGSATGPSDLSKDDNHHRALASGATAGMAATGLAASHAHKHHASEQDPEYNTLASGTASGVNPAHAHTHLHEAKADAPSVLDQDNHHQSRSTNPTSTYSMAPMPIRSNNHPLPSVPDESKPNPTPEQAKNMSPEVMPEAYTSTTRAPEPRHHAEAKNMSPEVMPDAYTSTTRAPEPRHPQLHHSAANPALAAAAGAWAASAGPRSGNAAGVGSSNGGPGKVSHKCGHCGGEEDISAEVKEAVRKIMQAKMKRGGKDGEMGGEENWWHDAWTSV